MRVVTIIAVLLTFLAIISTGAGTAAAEPDLGPCKTTPLRSKVVHQWETGSWGYLYRLIWCVEETEITWVVPEIVPILPDDSDCTWQGMEEESLEQVDDNWSGFAMGWFSCPNAPDRAAADYPWGRITVRPDGTSDIAEEGTD
jgi:hypothetical protein